MFARVLLVAVVTTTLCSSTLSGAGAQTAPIAPTADERGSVTGAISDEAGHPVSGVAIKFAGPASRTVITDANGAFTISDLTPGIYTVSLTKAGFSTTQSDLTVTAGNIVRIALQLSPVSLSSLRTIGRVTTNSQRVVLNTSTAAVNSVTGSDFIDQGQLNVTRTLNEVPGLSVGLATGYGTGLQVDAFNGASPAAQGIPVLRGSLPYETESLIDGHPIDLGQTGSFNAVFINPYILQDVEVVKGPGASATNINYAIGGTINYRTLEPTRTPETSFALGVDQFGGQNANVRSTGTTPDGKLGWAADYATQGTQGPNRGWNTLVPVAPSPGSTLINGQVACGNPAATGCGYGFIPANNTTIAGGTFTNAVDLCCGQTPLWDNSRNELAKLRYTFTPGTSLTLTYLGAQQYSASNFDDLYSLSNNIFTPPPGYTGSVPAGINTPWDRQAPGLDATIANLYSAELNTAVGPVSLSARYYAANVNQGSSFDSASYAGNLYGGVPLGNSLTPTILNGASGTVVNPDSPFALSENDKLSGYTVQASVPSGNNVYSVSFDAVDTSTSAGQFFSGVTQPIVVPQGSGQHFQTIAAKAQLQLTPALQAMLSNYATLYTEHYSQDFGATFADSTHAYDAPRLAFTYHPSSNVIVRAATGFSVAPPYISLLTNSSAQPNQSVQAQYFSVTANAGDVRPETAFGFDFGADWRAMQDTKISADVYQTTLHDQYLQSTSLSPTPYILGPNTGDGAPGPYPLYVTKTANLGHSKYEGIELEVQRNPAAGAGYKLQGAFTRAYAYDLPVGFYSTAAGPFTTNLAVLPYENFQPTGDGYNALGGGARVPYSQGYAEVNYRWRTGSYFLIGVTYYGPNNAYNNPPFGVVNASYRQTLSKNSSLLFAVTNLTNAYPAYGGDLFGGIPVALAGGQVGMSNSNVIGPSTANVTLQVHF